MGVFRDGFKGGVHLTQDPNEMALIVSKMLGNHLVTKQTTSSGILVSQVSLDSVFYSDFFGPLWFFLTTYEGLPSRLNVTPVA